MLMLKQYYNIGGTYFITYFNIFVVLVSRIKNMIDVYVINTDKLIFY